MMEQEPMISYIGLISSRFLSTEVKAAIARQGLFTNFGYLLYINIYIVQK